MELTAFVFCGGWATGALLFLAFSMICSFCRKKSESPETIPGEGR
jgi:hypothetical protein